ncbi:MAG: hypothetical protein ACREQV_15275, partial [Candidatus Binatia bacterium]
CLPDRRCRPGWRDARPADAGQVALGARTKTSTPLQPVAPLCPGHAARPAEASDQPAAVAHQLAVGHLVHLAPSLDATTDPPKVS